MSLGFSALSTEPLGSFGAVTLTEGTLAAQEQPDTITASVSVYNEVTLSIQEQPDVMEFIGYIGILDVVEPSDSFAAQGQVVNNAAISVQEAPDQSNIDGVVFWVVDISSMGEADTMAFSGAVIEYGDLAVTEQGDTFRASYLADYITPEGKYNLINLSAYYDIEVINVGYGIGVINVDYDIEVLHAD